MIARRTWSGGWYCEAYGDDYAVLFPGSHIETSRGRVELPADSGLGVLYLRLWADAQAVRLTGQGHSGTVGGDALLWDSRGGGWIGRGAAYGVSPCAFRPNGELVIADVSMGSQGIRQIAETEIVTGDQSYYDAALQLAEFTRLGLVYVGQGMSGGVVLISGAQRKRLADGACYFVRANRVGDQFAVAWWTRSGSGTDAHAVWFSLADLDQFPDDAPVTVPPPVEPPPVHPPVRPKEPNVSVIQAPEDFVAYAEQRWAALNVQAQIDALPADATREQLGAVASDALFLIVGEWHWTRNHPEVGLYPKTSGTNHNGFGEDIVLIKRGADVFWKDVGIAFGSRTPSLAVAGEYQKSNEPEKFAAPPKPSGGVIIVPPPPPVSDLEKRIAALEQIVKTQAIQIADVKRAAQLAQVEAIEAMEVADEATARVQTLSDTTPRKGDPVEVKGVLSVPFVGSRTITSRGTL